MSNENHTPFPPAPADPELEARIVAWVAGEASAAEIAALEHLVAVRPELAVFKRRIEAVHGLVAEAARPDAETLHLSPDRRAKLLAVLGSAASGSGGPSAAPKLKGEGKAKVVRMSGLATAKKKDRQWLFAVAACFVVVGMLTMLSIPSFQEVKMSSEGPRLQQEYRVSEATRREAEARLSEGAERRRLAMSESERDVSRYKAALEADALDETEHRRGLGEKKEMVRFKDGPVGRSAPAAAPTVARDGYSDYADDGATGVLEPFEVKEDLPRTGYGAAETLAGSRIRTELRDIGSSVTVVTNSFMKDVGATDKKGMLQYAPGAEVGGVAGKSDADRPRDNFLSKRKTERLGGKGGTPAPAAPAALGGEEEEVVVLSPFCIADPSSSSFLKGNRPLKKPKRPDPCLTAMGSADLNADQALLPEPSTASTPSTLSTLSTGSATAPAADQPRPRPDKKPLPPPTADEISAAQEPVSTFSLHVSDASFKLALAALNAGSLPDAASVRPEEFYNAFDYGDPAPAAGEQVSCRLEQSAHPFAQQRNLVRLAVRVPATGRGGGTPLNLTVLLDTSGSMERPDRRAAVRAALQTLVGLLGPADRVTLVGFARQPRLLAEALDGNHANQALDLLDRTPAEGGTNLEEALKLGGDLARRHFAAAAQNRIVLLTDGAANLGNADPERLAAAVESLRSQRIAFDACGVGLEGVDDDVLEALTRKGDGRYYVLNSPEAADAGFARQLAGAFRPAAENVKLQVRFNPARVGHYRLVGFEKHRLREEDFRNDAVDAAEISSEEAAVAVYEVEALPQGEGELGEVFVRFRDPTTRTMVERSWTLPYEPRAAAFDRASPSLQLAGTAAALAEKLRGGPAGDRVDLDALAPIVNAQRARRPDDKRIQDLATLFEQLRRMKK